MLTSKQSSPRQLRHLPNGFGLVFPSRSSAPRYKLRYSMDSVNYGYWRRELPLKRYKSESSPCSINTPVAPPLSWRHGPCLLARTAPHHAVPALLSEQRKSAIRVKGTCIRWHQMWMQVARAEESTARGVKSPDLRLSVLDQEFSPGYQDHGSRWVGVPGCVSNRRAYSSQSS